MRRKRRDVHRLDVLHKLAEFLEPAWFVVQPATITHLRVDLLAQHNKVRCILLVELASNRTRDLTRAIGNLFLCRWALKGRTDRDLMLAVAIPARSPPNILTEFAKEHDIGIFSVSKDVVLLDNFPTRLHDLIAMKDELGD